MTDRPYQSKSSGDLLSLFEDACLRLEDTYIQDDIERRIAELDTVFAVDNEFDLRGPATQRALLPLLQHSDPFVRLHAAKSVYVAAPAEARKCLEDLRDLKYPDASLAAGMTLFRLEQDPHCLDWKELARRYPDAGS